MMLDEKGNCYLYLSITIQIQLIEDLSNESLDTSKITLDEEYYEYYDIDAHLSAKKLSGGWKGGLFIRMGSLQSKTFSETIPQENSKKEYLCFVSHQWDSLALRLIDRLRNETTTLWLEEEQIVDDNGRSIPIEIGIENSICFLALISKKYISKIQSKDKSNCVRALEYQHKVYGCSHFIPIVVEDGIVNLQKFDGIIGELCRGTADQQVEVIDMSDESNWNKSLPALLRQMNKFKNIKKIHQQRSLSFRGNKDLETNQLLIEKEIDRRNRTSTTSTTMITTAMTTNTTSNNSHSKSSIPPEILTRNPSLKRMQSLNTMRTIEEIHHSSERSQSEEDDDDEDENEEADHRRDQNYGNKSSNRNNNHTKKMIINSNGDKNDMSRSNTVSKTNKTTGENVNNKFNVMGLVKQISHKNISRALSGLSGASKDLKPLTVVGNTNKSREGEGEAINKGSTVSDETPLVNGATGTSLRSPIGVYSSDNNDNYNVSNTCKL